MKGVLSAAPAPSAIRLLLGSQLLLLIQAGLVLSCQVSIVTPLGGLVLAIAVLGTVSLVAAIIGEQPASVACDKKGPGHGR